MKVCFFGIYDPEYSRNSILLSGLRQNGVEIVECREDWQDPKRYKKLRSRLRALNNEYDFIYAAYPSPVPTIIAKLVSKKPVVSDAFYSMFDSVVNDRRKYSRWSPIALRLLILDWLSLIFADIVIADTKAHATYWSKWFAISSKKIRAIYLGIDDKKIFPKPASKKDYILVHFHGYFIPLQGAPKIIEAANILKDRTDIRFRLIGNGRDFGKSKALSDRYGLSNVEFADSVSYESLNDRLAEADIVLGIFGDTDKAKRVIPNKIYEGLASKRAVISMDTPAVREIFSEKDLKFVGGNARSIADAILALADDGSLRATFAQNGYEAVMKYTPKQVGQMLLDAINQRIGPTP